MIIVEAVLKNFGKFRDTRISFGEGLTLIYGENEAGKTTLHTFLKAMLFGMEKQRGRTSKSDSYTNYEPWENSGSYEGLLRVKKGNTIYRIHRKFQKQDKMVEIINESTGASVTEAEWKELLEGLEEASFTNTISIGQMQVVTGKSLNEQLQNAVANLYSSGDMEWDMKKAFAFLAEEKKKLMKHYEPQLEAAVESAKAELEDLEKELMYRSIQKEEIQDQLEEIKADIEEKKEACQKAYKRKIQVTYQLIASLVCFLLTALCYFKGEWIGSICILGALSVMFAFLAWRGHDISGKSFDLLEVQKKEKNMQEQVQKVEWKLEQMKEKAAQFQGVLEAYERQIEGNRRVGEQIEALSLAENTLKKVGISMQKNFGFRMNGRLSEIMELLTDSKYNRLVIDEEGAIYVMERDRRISVHQLSRGTLEQIYLAFRLAAADCILGFGSLPLIFDDTFAYYDEKRLKRVLNYLVKEERQIVMFTCHKREELLLREMNIPFFSQEL